MTKAENIWRAYKMVKQQAEVIRSGFACYGIYQVVGGKYDRMRSESDLEHAAGLTALVMSFSMWYPELIPAEDRLTFMQTAMIHDLGEIATGDIPDNGTRDAAAKDRAELEVMNSFAELLPAAEIKDTLALFTEFQQRSTRRGKILYLADKLEAVLQTFFYEAEGRVGWLGLEPSYRPSDRDIEYSDATKDSTTASTWSYHFYQITRELSAEDSEIVDPFIEVLAEAALSVRGKWFDWWK